MNLTTLENLLLALKQQENATTITEIKGLSSLGPLLFYPKDNQRSQHEKALDLIKKHVQNSDEFINSLKEYHFTSFYTPENLIDFQINYLKSNNFTPHEILEPSAGSGNYVRKLSEAYPNSIITALEPDILSYKMLVHNTKNLPNVKTIKTSFEKYYLKDKEKRKFDLVITNCPFGDINIKSSFLHSLTSSKEKNVNIFFNTHMPKMLKKEGISMNLTSRGFMDRKDTEILRKELLEQNKFIDTIRFSNQLFKNEKTKVVTDLIILQHQEQPNNSQKLHEQFTTTTEVKINENLHTINSYLYQNPDKINGTITEGYFFNHKSITVVPILSDEQYLKQVQLNPIQHTYSKTKNLTSSKSITRQKGTLQKETITNQVVDISQFTFQINAKGLAILVNNPNDPSKNLLVPKKYQTTVRNYINLRTQYLDLKKTITYKLKDDSNNDNSQEDKIKLQFSNLDYSIDSFLFQHESIQENTYNLEDDYYSAELSRLIEKKVNGVYIKNPNIKLSLFIDEYRKQQNPSPKQALKQPTTNDLTFNKKFPTPHYTSKDLKTLVYQQYNYTGKINLEELSTLTGKTKKELSAQALKEELFYYELSRNEIEPVLFHEFTTGNIDEKIKNYNNTTLPSYIEANKAITVLNTYKNQYLPISKIEFNLESVFIPIQAKKDFFKFLINENINIIHSTSNNLLTPVFSQRINKDAEERYSVYINQQKRYSYQKIITQLFKNQIPTVYKSILQSDGTTLKTIDKEATLMASNIYEQLQLEFKEYIYLNPETVKEIELAYYNTFLSKVNKKTSLEILSFPKSIQHSLYPHQKQGTQFALSNKTGLFDHKVGHGKTLTMSLTAYKLLQHKKAKRILIATLNAVAPQMTKELQTNFPMLNIKRLSSKELNPQNISHTLERLKNSQIDIIICEHNHLLKLPKEKSIIQKVFEERIKHITLDLETAKKAGLKETKQIIKGLINRKSNLENTLESLLHNNETLSEITIKDLEIDALFLDECHYFKNIGYTTRHNRVSGLNDGTDKAKTLDLEITIRSIHERTTKDQNIFFYSGTPIKNSVTELYAYQRYLTPFDMKSKQLHNFDAWASIFLKQDMQIEADILGKPRKHTRFRYFTNLPELSNIYHSFTHISNDSTYLTTDIPLIEKFYSLTPPKIYKQLQEASIEFINGNQLPLFSEDKYNNEQLKSKYITALNVNRIALVDPLLSKHKGVQIDFKEKHQVKLNTLINHVVARYHETSKDLGTLLIFSNIGVYKKNESYTTYDTIKKILVEKHNIPERQIDVAQQAKDEKRMNSFQENVRTGKIRIAIGSTQTLGTGTNIQSRIVGIYNLDIPYSPDEWIQRLGRGIRAGNLIAKKYEGVEFFSYGYINTTDIFSFSLNKHKERFLNQLKVLNPTQRTFDDVLTKAEHLSHQQREAALVGDEKTFKLVKLESTLDNLKTEQKMFNIKLNNAERTINHATKENQILLKENIILNKVEKELSRYIPDKNTIHNNQDLIEKTIQKYTTLYKNNINENPHLSFLTLQTPTKDKFKLLTHILKDKTLNGITYDDKNSSTLIELSDSATLQFRKIPEPNTSKHYFFLKIPYQLKNPITHKESIRHIIITGQKQTKFDPNKIIYQLFKLYNEIPRQIQNRNFKFNENLNKIESNRKNLKITFPKKKTNKILSLQKEITSIKKQSKGISK